MKNILSFILLLCSYSLSGQEFRSEILNYTSHCQYDDGKLTQIDSVCILVNTRMGDHDAEIVIPYSKGDKLIINEGWIEDMAGNIVRKLKGKDIKDRSSISDISLYEDDFVKFFELKHNVYPYKIFYSYKIFYAKSLSIAGFDYSNAKRPLKNGKLIVNTPIDQPIKFLQRNIKSMQTETDGNNVRHTWIFSHSGKTREINAPYYDTTTTQLIVLPLNFQYGAKGSWDSWQTFGNWISRLNSGKDALPHSEKEKINNLLANIDDEREKIKILYKYMQDVSRYINVNINLGGLQTYSAEYVCTNRYGDCKALSNYMKSVLSYAGIQSYYTLVYSGYKIPELDVTFPYQAFNHVILTVPLEKDTLYLECTSKNYPMGYVHTDIQGRKALIVDGDSSRFTTIPSLKGQDVLCSRTIEADLNDFNLSDIKLKTILRGENYEQSNFLMNDMNKNQTDLYVRNNILSGSFELIDFKFNKESRDKANIEMEALIQIRNLYKKYGNNLIITSFPVKLTSYEAVDKRTQDVHLPYPEFHQDSIVYTLPYNTIAKVPENIKIDSEFGNYNLNFTTDNNKLIIIKSLFISSGRYPISDYKKFFNFITTIKESENKNIYLEVL